MTKNNKLANIFWFIMPKRKKSKHLRRADQREVRRRKKQSKIGKPKNR